MIAVPPSMQTFFDDELHNYIQLKKDLKDAADKAKKQLLTSDLGRFPFDGDNSDKIHYIIDLVQLLQHLVLFPDEQVHAKLREMDIKPRITRWLIDFEEVDSEINRINNIEGLLIFRSSLLFAVESHLMISLYIEVLEFFGQDVKHNNVETNIVFKSFDNLIRRVEYNPNSSKKKPLDLGDWVAYMSIKAFESMVAEEDRESFQKMILKSMKGNTAFYIDMFNLWHNEGISKRRTYLEFFPLFQKILLKQKLLSYEDFMNSKDQHYDCSYENYQVSKIKKILLKK